MNETVMSPEAMTIVISMGVGVLGIIGTLLGVVIPLHISLSSKTDKLLQAMNAEMKDFHGRLCAIEERRKQ